MDIPQGYSNIACLTGQINKVCKLLKPLYGLKQSSRQWNIKLTKSLITYSNSQSKMDYSLFTKQLGNTWVYLVIYVDDLLITGSDPTLIEELKKTLCCNFKLKYLGLLQYFLGIEVTRSNDGIVVNQRKYALELLDDTGLVAARPSPTPMEQHL